jgi:hypothetical protein
MWNLVYVNTPFICHSRLPLEESITGDVHRRYILIVVSILYQCAGYKGTRLQQAERKQQGRAWLDTLFKPEFNLGGFPTKTTKVLSCCPPKGIVNSQKYQTHLSSLEKEEWRGHCLISQCVIPVPCSAISHFYGKRISSSNNFAVLDRTDKLDNVIFGMRQELKGELPWQKFVSLLISTISLLILIVLFLYSGACPERIKNWILRPVIQLQKSNTQIPCYRTHIQNKGNAVTDRKHK